MSLFDSAKAAPILEVAQKLGLTVYRSNLVHCPNHSNDDRVDEHASCSLNPRTNHFRCFSCGNTGSPVDLVAQVMEITPKEAAAWITAGGERRVVTNHPTEGALGITDEWRSQMLADLLELCGPPSQPAIAYLEDRGICRQTVASCRIADVSDYHTVNRELKRRHNPVALSVAGLLSRKYCLKFWRHHLLFPFLLGGRPVFLQGRRTEGDEKPKYLSLSGAIPCLYNLDCLETEGDVWLCEGIIDTLTALSEGKLAVGVIGAFGFKPEWASLFRTRDVVLALDADHAGRSGTAVIERLLEQAGATVHLASVPDGHDVNSYYCSTGLLPEIA